MRDERAYLQAGGHFCAFAGSGRYFEINSCLSLETVLKYHIVRQEQDGPLVQGVLRTSNLIRRSRDERNRDYQEH